MEAFLADMVSDGTVFTFLVAIIILLAAWAWGKSLDEDDLPKGHMG